MTVYLVQDTKWVDPRDGKLKSKFDYQDASRFGELKELLGPGASPFSLAPALCLLHAGLDHYTDNDFLLLVGSPVLIGLAVAIAADANNGNVSMLQWSGAKHQYIPVRANSIF